MRALRTPNGDGANAIDSFQPGVVAEVVVHTGASAFPPEDKFPHGGRFFIDVPDGSTVVLQTEEDGPSFPLYPGIWDLAFDEAEEVHLSADADTTLKVLQQKEVE